MACHAMWMWWLHEALALTDTDDVMVMNTVVWGRGLERAVRGLRREFAVFAPGRTGRHTEGQTHAEKEPKGRAESGSETTRTVMVRMLALREGAVYNVSTLTGSAEYTATTLAAGVAVPVNSGGEGTLVVELLRGRVGGVRAVAEEAAALLAAEAAQGLYSLSLSLSLSLSDSSLSHCRSDGERLRRAAVCATNRYRGTDSKGAHLAEQSLYFATYITVIL